MKNFKKFLVGALVVLAVVAYPLTSKGKTDPNKIVLNSSNTVKLTGIIDADSVSKTIVELRKLDSKSSYSKQKPIYLFVYSPGGSIQDGLELIEAAKGLNRSVDTVTMFAASMAFQTVQNLGERHILKSGVLMSHRAAGGFEGYFGGESPSQLDSRYGFWLQRIKELDEKTVERTNGKQTLESYRKQYANEEWLTGPQSVQMGYADSIVTVQCDSSLDGTDEHNISYFGIQIQYETSHCPLISSPLNVKVIGSSQGEVNKAMEQEVKNKFLESFQLEKMVK